MSEKEKDIMFNLKYIGYCMSQMPPEGVNRDFKDFINYCKYQLCHFTRTLFSDPIWDSYTDESIISEYFALLFSENKDKKEEFEMQFLSDEKVDFLEWADEQIEKEKTKLEKKEEFSYSPSLGE